jgi:LacI family transcriptional regulator
VVGLLVDYLSSSYMDEIIRGIDGALDAANYDLMLYTTHRRKTKESTYVTKLTRNLADGLLPTFRSPGSAAIRWFLCRP